MALIIEMSLFYRDHADNLNEITIIPHSQDPATLKQQVGKELAKIRDSGEIVPGESYYYLVLKARKLGGGIGYRTQIPKTFF